MPHSDSFAGSRHSRSWSARRPGAVWSGVLSLCLIAASIVRADDGEAEMLSESHLLSGSVVRWAFRDVISEPRTWTVRLQSASGKSLALGTIVDADGWIVTKGSEIKTPLVCRLADGRRFDAAYVGYHEPTDTALLKIDATNLPVTTWSSENNLQEGQWLISVGTGRRPQAVGVLSVARRKIPRQAQSGVLGIAFSPESEEPVVQQVFNDSGARAAGLQTGDRILRVNETAVDTRAAVIRQISSRRPGDRVSLQLRRGSQRLTVWATLTHPESVGSSFLDRVALQNAMGGPLSFRRDDFPAVIQQDAVLAPDDCGGPVVNIKGEAVGINIARAGRTETYVLPYDAFASLIGEMQAGMFPPTIEKPPGLDESPAPAAPELPSPVPVE